MLSGFFRKLYRNVERLRNRQDIALLKASELFDADWYLKQYPDVYESGMDPAEHYIRFGQSDGREPSPFFRGDIYLALHPDARKAGIGPLCHYLRSVRRRPANARLEADWEFLKKISATSAANRPQTDLERQPKTTKSPDTVRRAGLAASTNPASLNIVLINYGPFNNNSGLHICGLANALANLGHRVVVSAVGRAGDLGDLDAPDLFTVSHRRIRENPEILTELFAGSRKRAPDFVHCWTPRQAHWSVVRSVVDKYRCPYIVHFEDNEMAVARAYGSVSPPDSITTTSRSLRGKLPPEIDEFVAGAAGATIIVEALRELLPAGLPVHLLEPGVDTELFSPGTDSVGRARLREALDVPVDASVIVYPGNIHPANADDVFSLYAAIQALNALGHRVHLIRTGEDNIPVIDPRFAQLSSQHVTNLGLVHRQRLIKILKSADFFVQPGGPDDFNSYRLPSKLPEFFAVGRPVILPRTNIGLLMQDGVNAILMQRGDAAEIARCVQMLINDPTLADRVGLEGRRFAIKHFNWNRSATQLAAFYQRLLQR
jgi:glycosyltransferase involved in cell wall biosynthesis